MSNHNKKMVFSVAIGSFHGEKFVFRFLPVACFTNLFISVLSVVANKKKWLIKPWNF